MDELKQLLGDLLDLLDESFGAKYFRARFITLDNFEYLNDEEIDKKEELEEDETIVISRWDTSDLKKFSDERRRGTIAAVDAASVRIGETEKGVISAIRLAIVVKNADGTVNITKLGPYVFHITEENKEDVYNYFRTYFNLILLLLL